MRPFLRATMPRVVLVVSLIVLLVGGVVGSASAHLATFDRGSVAQVAQENRTALATTQSQRTAAAHLTATAAGAALVAAGVADLDASAGKVDQAARAALASALDRLRTSVGSGTDREILAASTVVNQTRRAVGDAAASGDAEQTRVTTQADAAKAAAAAEAAQSAAQQEARAESARLAAMGDAARAAAIAQAAREAAPAVSMIDIVGSISGTGVRTPGTPGSTFEADEVTGECHLLGVNADIAAGTSVTVYDSSGAIVGTGALVAGKTSAIKTTAQGDVGTCEFGFVVRVPDGTPFRVEVAHRGKVAVSRTAVGGVSLSLG